VSKFDRPLRAEEFIENSKGSDAVLTLLTDKIDGEVIDALGPQLKIVSNYAVGFDNIKVPEATEKGVVVTNTPSDEVNESVAEHAWALMLAVSRRIVESDEAVRGGAYAGWEPDIFLGDNLFGKTLGIVGLGRIGMMMASKAAGFNMKVLYNKRSRDEEAERELGIEYAELDDLYARSDYLSLHVPLTEETRHMINKESINKMKHGIYIVNTARGSIIDEHDLARSLRDGHVKGAAIDVFDNEPYVNPEFISMENIILTPHIASATYEAREKMTSQAVGSILKVLKGEKPEEIVNEDVWESRRS
jgi:glyoxylate reductase